ncbi:MAG: DUF6470 family protein [Oscillospiraceae bacterium]|nr:DUF6470 family protein [Oscillospiraceae bacterium]
MRLPRLEIHTQMGTLDVRTRRARLEGTPPYLTTTIRGNAGAKVGLDITPPRILIDNTPSRESMGIYKVLRHMDRFAAQGSQRANEQIGRIAREGLELMKIERGGGGKDAIQRIARNKGRKNVRLTIKPVTPPSISAQMGTVAVRNESATVRTAVQEGADTTRYTPASVAVTWKTRPSIEITVIPGGHTGVNVDELV